MFIAVVLTIGCALVWVGLCLEPVRRWDFQPVDEQLADSPMPPVWPTIAVVVPARNEAESLESTLAAWLRQDYPGEWHLWLVDDRSSDGTAAIAERIGEGRITVLRITEKREGWMGKVAALDAGLRAVVANGEPQYLLCTDADILHAPDSLRRLVAESFAGDLDLNSRMARLRCESLAERLCMPAFVYYFNLLYPMRSINAGRMAGAAGGCVLLSRRAMRGLGWSFAAIRQCVIDDVNLAAAVWKGGGRLRLALSADRVVSLREYPDLEAISAMVSRSAYAQLGYRWWLGMLVLVGLAWLFVVPVAAVIGGLVWREWWMVVGGVLASAAMAVTYQPAVRFFRLPPWWCVTLPVAAILYGWMTLRSIWSHHRCGEVVWRDKG